MKYIITTITLCILSFSLNANTAKSGDIVVSIKPLHSMVSGVLGDTKKAKLLVKGATSPHHFHLKPSHIKLLQNADVVFYIDEEFETFMAKTLKILPLKVKQISVANSANIKLLSYRDEHHWEEYNKQHKEHNEHNHHSHNDHDDEHEEHDSHDHHDGHDHGEHDLHIWLDPKNAEKIVSFVAKKLSDLYPENKKLYTANAKNYIAKLKKLDKKLANKLHKVEDAPYIVFHDAYQYFDRAYNLNPVGVIKLNPNSSPSAKQLKKIQQTLKHSGAKCVFSEPQFPKRLVKTVTERTPVNSVVIDPLGAYIKDGEDLYFTLIENLANNMIQCLQ